MLTLGNNLEQSNVILIVSLYNSVEKMNIYQKTKNGGPVKTDKDIYPRNGPKRFELHLFRAFDVFKHGHFVPNQVA